MKKTKTNKYTHPVPSPNDISKKLNELIFPKKFDELCDLFSISEEKLKRSFQRTLFKMTKQKLIKKNKKAEYLIPRKHKTVQGVVSEAREGFGFVILENDDDVYLSNHEMRSLMHGDTVQIKVIQQRDGRQTGELIKIIERHSKYAQGELIFSKGKYYLKYLKRNLKKKFILNKATIGNAEIGNYIEVEITKYPSKLDDSIYGKVIHTIGEKSKKGIHTDLAIKLYELPHEWPEDVLKEISVYNNYEDEDQEVYTSRKDLRHINFITIDGTDAKDFDDAVFCHPSENGWKLFVAIADVEHFVSIGSAVDNEALQRGTSVYFYDRVLPMLPEVLSNNLCSLRPNKPRLAIVCEMDIDFDGSAKNSKFYKAVIESKARLTYSQVSSLIADGDFSSVTSSTSDLIENLSNLYKAQTTYRKKRGAINLDLPQMRIILNDNNEMRGVKNITRSIAHGIIEECMIAANVEAAEFIKKSGIPTLYRNHDVPDKESIEDLYRLLRSQGINTSSSKEISPNALNKILSQLENNPKKDLISMMMLRTFSQANYCQDNIGHFGLALSLYSHFTSPIRRYPDLLVHRAISHIIDKSRQKNPVYSENKMKYFGEMCSKNERRAEKATREAEMMLKCQFLEDKVGHNYKGLITSVHGFGFFVQLNDFLIEGLVHVTSLTQDYFIFDKIRKVLIGEKTNKIFKIGDQIEVVISDVDVAAQKISFTPIK